MEMGFPPEACKRAIFFTQNTGAEPATQWLMDHITDTDFGDPFVPPGTDNVRGGNGDFKPDPSGIEAIVCMGFNEKNAVKALKATNNNVERAVDWIFSHISELDAMEVGSDESENTKPTNRDGDSSKCLSLINGHYAIFTIT